MTFTPRVSAPSTDRTGFASAAIAAIVFGAAYPVTAIALRSFQPVALAALTGTLALAVIVLLAVVGPLSRPRSWVLTRGQAGQLAVLGLLGGVAFAAAMNVAVVLAGPTITSFVATLYAVLATLLAVPLLGERIRPSTVRVWMSGGSLATEGAAPSGWPQPIGSGSPRTGQRKSAAASRTIVSSPLATRDSSCDQLVTRVEASPDVQVARYTAQRPPWWPVGDPGANSATPFWSALVELVNVAKGSVPVPSGTLAAFPNTR